MPKKDKGRSDAKRLRCLQAQYKKHIQQPEYRDTVVNKIDELGRPYIYTSVVMTRNGRIMQRIATLSNSK